MSIILTIILGYLGLVLFVMLLTWWAYKRSQKNIPIGLRTYPHTTPPAEMDTEIECQLMSVDVIIVDADGETFISFYDHKMIGWVHHHDKFQPRKPFVWMYIPKNLKV
ncbi:MAG TPA: hypothetical protein ENH85_06930 [Candidatus Scalindua sp.]|nr:hypothetical protein [Candidatus Scalindua sp.]